MKIMSIIIKDLKVMFSDKKALGIMILMPMILTTILSFALKGSFSSGSDGDFEPVNIAVVKQYNAQEDLEMFKSSLSNNFYLKGMEEAELNDLMKEIMEGMEDVMQSIKINIDEVVLEGRKPIKSSDYYAVAMMTMFILFAAGQGGRMLLEEKDNLTYQRMVVGGVSKFQVLSGKFTTVFIIALFQIIVMVTFSSLALKVQWGNLGSVALISIAVSFAVAGLGSFIGALTYRAGNYKMANAFENVIIQGMALIGGSFFPIDVMPEFMQKLSFLSLNGVALKSYLKIIKGYNTADILNNLLILALTGAVFTVLAVMVLKGKEGESHAKHNKIKTSQA